MRWVYIVVRLLDTHVGRRTRVEPSIRQPDWTIVALLGGILAGLCWIGRGPVGP
jgi:hypothetical protein